MSRIWETSDAARLDEAAEWVVRLQSKNVSESDALAFDAWLLASSRNGEAYDAVVGIAHEYDAVREPVLAALDRDRGAWPTSVPRRAFLVGGGIAAAAAAAVAVAPMLPATAQSYATGPGERRSLTLADGSRVEMNGATRLTVSFQRRERRVRIDEGEAVFDVAHDPSKPFRVAAGDYAVRVVGTQFNVRRRGGRLAVSVARGAVEVGPVEAGAGRTYRLHPGQRLDHTEGAAAAQVASSGADDAFAWRSGRLIYRDATLQEVVEDLNSQFARPIRIDGQGLAALPVSGVLVLDDQDAVVRRLALLAPITAIQSPSGVLLKRDEASQR